MEKLDSLKKRAEQTLDVLLSATDDAGFAQYMDPIIWRVVQNSTFMRY